MTLADVGSAIDLSHLCAWLEIAGVGPETHRPTFVVHCFLTLHDVYDCARGLLVKLSARRVSDLRHVTRVFDSRDL